jgi:hypothetical protein
MKILIKSLVKSTISRILLCSSVPTEVIFLLFGRHGATTLAATGHLCFNGYVKEGL